jgi:hypothetical protein
MYQFTLINIGAQFITCHEKHRVGKKSLGLKGLYFITEKCLQSSAILGIGLNPYCSGDMIDYFILWQLYLYHT